MNIADLGGSRTTVGSLGYALDANSYPSSNYKLVNLDLSGSTFAIIGDRAFGCFNLTGITIPNSVTSIENNAFISCTSLTSITFQGTIASGNLHTSAFHSEQLGDLRDKYLAGGAGTYTRSGSGSTAVWTKS